MSKRFVYVAVAVAATCVFVAAMAPYGFSSNSSGSRAAAANTAPAASVSFQLTWFPQAEFAGYYVAEAKGFYAQRNLKVKIVPGGPSVNPVTAIANGSANIGESQPSSVALARAQGLKLVELYQFSQKSATVYVAKKSSGIRTLKDVVGKRVGLYFGGYQAEFLSMLDYAGIDKSKVSMFPQSSSVIPFLKGKYDVAMALRWNELLQIEDQIPASDLTLLDPADYGGGLVGGGIVTSESYLKNNASTIQRFLDATAEGWSWSVEHPDKAAAIVTKAATGLKLDFQKRQMNQVLKVICTGATLKPNKGLGYITPAFFSTGQQILLKTKQIKKSSPTNAMYTTKFWNAIPATYKHPKCPAGATTG